MPCLPEGLFEGYRSACRGLRIRPTDHALLVSVCEQKLYHVKAHSGALLGTYRVSTSRRPPSNVIDSQGTPHGLHAVCEKIGADQPKGMVFKARVPQGFCYDDATAANDRTDSPTTPLITSRILRLAGLQDGVNRGGQVDSFARHIYIHGTNFEQLIGTPASAGCVNMLNDDILQLFDAIPCDSHVWIDTANPPPPAPPPAPSQCE